MFSPSAMPAAAHQRARRRPGAFLAALVMLALAAGAGAMDGGASIPHEGCSCATVDSSTVCSKTLTCHWIPTTDAQPAAAGRCKPLEDSTSSCSELARDACSASARNLDINDACIWLEVATEDLDIGCHSTDHVSCSNLGQRSCGHSRSGTTDSCEWTTATATAPTTATSAGQCVDKPAIEARVSCINACLHRQTQELMKHCFDACINGAATCAQLSHAEIKRVSSASDHLWQIAATDRSNWRQF